MDIKESLTLKKTLTSLINLYSIEDILDQLWIIQGDRVSEWIESKDYVYGEGVIDYISDNVEYYR